jgi:hypothetical protein
VDGQGASVRHAAPPGSPGGFMYHNGFTEIIGALGAGKNRMYIIPSLNAVILRQTLQERDDYDDHTFLSFLLDDFIVSIEEVAVEICDNDSIFLENAWQTEAGTYHDTLATLAGYDSILVTELKVNSRYYHMKEKEICNGDSVLWQDNYISKAGTYYDTLTSVNGCDSIFELDLTVIPLPNVDLGPNTNYCFGEFVTLMVDDSHAYYEWSDNTTGSYTITLDSTDYTIGSNEFYVIVTSEEGCVNSDSVLIDIETCSNITSLQEKLIHIYPNPSGEILIIRSVSPEEYEIAEIVTPNGQILFSRSMDKFNQVNKFNISSLTEGIYFLKLIGKDKVKTYKFVKK